MTKVIREFSGTCRNVAYDYKLVKDCNEYRLESYFDGEFIDSVSWVLSMDLDILITACIEIETRGIETRGQRRVAC